MTRLVEFDVPAAAGPESLRDWLAALPEDGPERLLAIGRILVRSGRGELAADAFMTRLEQLRPVLLQTVDDCLSGVENRQLPYGADAWRRLVDALTTMRALRTMYRRAASRIRREAPSGAGTEDPARRALPLIRALDLQSRILAALLLHRVEPLAEDWDELCALGGRARATGLVDAQIPDSRPLVVPSTARALFVFPLLLRLADLAGRSRAEAATVLQVAGTVAARIGFRIDSGVPKANPLGPGLALTGSSGVRLDTHRLPALLARHSEIESALIAELGRLWAGTPAEASGANPAAGLEAGPGVVRGVLHFGLPRRGEPDAATARPGQSAASRTDAGYVFGQWERNTIIRLSMAVSAGSKPVDDFDPLASAEPVRYRIDSGQVLLERNLMLPPAPLGGLAAIRAFASPVRLGTIRSVAQIPAPGYERLLGHRLVLALWPGQAIAVGLRMGAARFFDDAWLLRAQPGQPAVRDTLVIPSGLAAHGGRAVLREGGRDRPIRFGAAIASGQGFERLGFIVDEEGTG